MTTMRSAVLAAAVFLTLLAATRANADAPPTAPSNLHAASITDTDIVLAWSPSTDDSGAVNYAIFFDDNPTPFLASGDTTFDVHLNRAIGMIPGSTHSFQVRAEDPSGNHTFSNTLTTSFAPGDNTPPTAPQNLRAVSDTAAGIELAWDPSTDTSSFDYRVSGAPCGGGAVTVTHVLVPSVSSDPVCGIAPGGTYTFTVTALDEFLNPSAPSNRLTVTFAGG